ncbi:MAG: cyclopropane-fatty-acyl-phospholipid synthase family protein [Rubripirellula sp.]
MSDAESAATVARDYYNSSDADHFYAQVWGGEDIHVGMYRASDEPIGDASHRTVQHLSKRLEGIGPDSRVLDIGSGYGGAARYLAKTFHCHVTCLNLSEVENERNRQLNDAAGLAEKIRVVDGSFEAIPVEDASFDFVWSQDAILHSGNRKRVFQEVDRALRSGGQFVMTDPMKADSCPDGVLQPILDRLHLSDLSSPQTYRGYASELGWQDLGFQPFTEHLVQHYSSVLARMQTLESQLLENISADYIERMKRGLQYWIDGGSADHLTWGVFLFQKPE